VAAAEQASSTCDAPQLISYVSRSALTTGNWPFQKFHSPGVQHLDQELLDTIGSMVAHLEVSAHRSADWQHAILAGYQAWRHLRGNGGGAVKLNMEQQTLTVA
jgi:hypothetical protein